MFSDPDRQLGPYRLLRQIGRGNMGKVYLAEDTRVGFSRQVAIKMISAEIDPYPDQAAIKDAERLFKREMEAIVKLNHPYILPLYDFGEERVDDAILTYMVMPFLPEGSLANWLQRRDTTKPLSPEEAAHFVGQAAQALQHAHSHGLIHQDVKPANFLIRDRSSDQALPDILLADFGIVKITTATATASQSIRGTPAYMPPEQWNGRPIPATDQYALAIMAYSLLTRQVPFTGSMEQVMRQHLDARPQPPSTYNPNLPQLLDSVILTALKKSPQERFASISAFGNAFRQAAQLSTPEYVPPPPPLPEPTIYPPPPPPIPPTVPVSPVPRQRTGLFITIGILVLLILASIVGGVTLHQNQVNTQATADAQSTVDNQATADAQASATAQATADVQSTADAQASATAQVLVNNPCPSNYIQDCASFSLALLDPLQGPDNWQESSDSSFGGNCQFSNNTLQVNQTQPRRLYFCSEQRSFSNFIFEVQMASVQGDCGGIVIRDDQNAGHDYVFVICPNTGNANFQYALFKYTGFNGADSTTLTSGNSASIASSGTNTLAVAAINNSIILYVNQQKIASVNDSSFSNGVIGLIASDYSASTLATYTNARVWA